MLFSLLPAWAAAEEETTFEVNRVGDLLRRVAPGEQFTLQAEVLVDNTEDLTFQWRKHWQNTDGEWSDIYDMGVNDSQLTDTLYGPADYWLRVTDRYNNSTVYYKVMIDNRLQATVDGKGESRSANYYAFPEEIFTLKAAVNAVETDNLSYSWTQETHYENGAVTLQGLDAYGTEITSAALTENVSYYCYSFHVMDPYGGVATADFFIYPFTQNCGENGDNVTWSFDENSGVMTVSGSGRMMDHKGAWERYEDRITAVVVEDGVTGVGADTFSNMTYITKVTLPNSVRSIEYSSFENCTSLKEVNFPDQLESIGANAFRSTDLREVNLPAGVRSIAYSGFEGCTNLTSVSLPDSLEEIGDRTFAESGVTQITLPKSVRTLAYELFAGCTDLAEVVLPDNLESISDYSFIDNKSLREISIPGNTTTIYPTAFNGCDNLHMVYYTGTEDQWAALTADPDSVVLQSAQIVYLSPDEKIFILPIGLKTLGVQALAGVDAEMIVIPSSCEQVASDAFEGCLNLRYIINHSELEIPVPDSVTVIRD